jgi:hypothetical protein
MMNRSSSRVEERALQLALSLATSVDGQVSRKTIDDHFGPEADLLISMGILALEGHATSIATEEDASAAVEWSAERSCFGYFSETDGCVDLAADALSTFGLQVGRLVKLLVCQMNIQPKELLSEIKPGLLWELGACRLPGRSKRVVLWIARRLPDPVVWRAFVQATRDRPTEELRMVVHLAEGEIPDTPFLANHAVIAAGSVLSAIRPFEIDVQIASARLRNPTISESPVSLSADRGYLIVHGKTYTFRGGKQRSIARSLFDAWIRGEPRRLTEEVLLEAESGASVRRLARAFKAHPNRHEIIKEKGGICWLEI